MCERDWGALLHWAQTRLIALAARHGVPEGEREDIVQEALLSVYGRRHVRHPEAYLRGAVVKLCKLYWRRRQQRFEETLDECSQELRAEPPDQEHWSKSEDLRRAIAALPKRYRAFAELRYLYGFTTGEIAFFTGLSEKAIYNACQRTIQKLRELVAEGGVEKIASSSQKRRGATDRPARDLEEEKRLFEENFSKTSFSDDFDPPI